MKRFLSKLFKRREKTKVYHINYSDKMTSEVAIPGHTMLIGTIRDQAGSIVGQFFYVMTEVGAVVCPRDRNHKYYIAKDQSSPLAIVDAYIDPVVGALTNAHSLREFLKLEFGI